MGQLDLIKEILEKILEEASAEGVKRVKRAEITLGESFPMQAGELKYWLTELARGTPAENAHFMFKKGKIKGSTFVITEISEY